MSLCSEDRTDCVIECHSCRKNTIHQTQLMHTVENHEDNYIVLAECTECGAYSERVIDSTDSKIDDLCESNSEVSWSEEVRKSDDL